MKPSCDSVKLMARSENSNNCIVQRSTGEKYDKTGLLPRGKAAFWHTRRRRLDPRPPVGWCMHITATLPLTCPILQNAAFTKRGYRHSRCSRLSYKIDLYKSVLVGIPRPPDYHLMPFCCLASLLVSVYLWSAWQILDFDNFQQRGI
jgi:hypothetical protein